ncbi:MAG: response regulator transcription factor [Bacteroidetes bacterium]|nr:response regulator transcription factor [Bacteroidota bacterium]
MFENINLLIADDHAIIRRGLKFLIDTQFKGIPITETDSLSGISQLINEKRFTHLILDMQLLDGNILEIFSTIKNEHPEVKTLIYSMSSKEVFGKRMIELGADGFLSKESSETDVISGLDLFFKGKKIFLSILKTNTLSGKSSNPLTLLSDRELTVFTYLIKGMGVKEISNKLNLKPTTVATFKARIFDKLGVSNVIDLQQIAEFHNIKGS